MKKIVDSLPEAAQGPMANFFMNVRDHSVSAHDVGHPQQIYLHGPAGTGKTTLAQSIGPALGLPSYTIAMDGNMFDLAQRILQKMIESGVSNPVIVLDDVGASLNKSFDQLNRFFDPGKTNMDLGDLDGVSMRKVTLVCTGNSPINDHALRSRLPQIDMPRIGEKQRRIIANETFEAKTAELAAILPADKINHITAIAKTHLEYIISKDMTKNPGARILVAVISNTLFSEVRRQLENGGKVAELEMHQAIDAAFLSNRLPDDVAHHEDADPSRRMPATSRGLAASYYNR